MKKHKQNNNEFVQDLENEGQNNLSSENDNNQARDIEYEKELENKINDLEAQVRQEQELRLRALADYQNLERRVERDKHRILSLSKAQIGEALIPFIDDFERAIEHMKKDELVRDYYAGLSSVWQRLVDILKQFGIYEIDCQVGDAFDSNKHEAVGIVNQDRAELDNTIAQIVNKGYELRDEEDSLILRNVRVIVAKKSSS